MLVTQTSNYREQVKMSSFPNIAGDAEKQIPSDVKITDFNWNLPEGYQLLPVKYFKHKGTPPPLVSISWFSSLNSDEESEEDYVPLARLKGKLNKLEQSKKTNKKEENSRWNKIYRKRGRPKKCPEPEIVDNVFDDVKNENLLINQSDSYSEPEMRKETEAPDSEEDQSASYLEHSYSKSTETDVFSELGNDEIEMEHKKKEGALKTSFPCLECGKTFSAANTLKSHQRIHNGTLLKCKECHKGFITKYLLKCHMRIHNGDLFMCQKCGKGFTTAEVLKIHNRCHTGDKPFVCDICCKSFPSASNLSQHKQIHNSEKTFLCSQCGSSFSQKRNLEFHMLTHAEKSHICNVCGKLWARKSYLIEHMRVHTGVKPYCCTLCPQKFTQASSLKRHQIVHVNDKPIKCETCNKTFKSQNYYKRHLRIHLKES